MGSAKNKKIITKEEFRKLMLKKGKSQAFIDETIKLHEEEFPNDPESQSKMFEFELSLYPSDVRIWYNTLA